MNGQEGKESVSSNKDCMLYLEILIEEDEPEWALFPAAASAVSKPTPAIWKMEKGHCVSAVLWLLLMYSR